MQKILLLIVISLTTTTLFAQQPKVVAQTTPALPAKVVPVVPTKELKRQLESNFKRKKYKNVLPIADTLLKRNKKDENAFAKKTASEVILKMDKEAIADIKNWYKNKDTAASNIAFIPSDFYFADKKRSGTIYYKSAMAWAPKNGLPYIFYAAELADAQQSAEAYKYAKKGYDLLKGSYKKAFVPTYAYVLHQADKKEEAYKLLEDEISSGNTTDDIIKSYFSLFRKDKEYQKGIDKATEFIEKEPKAGYYGNRAALYNETGNNEKACEDAIVLKEKYNEEDYWLKRFGCPQVMADVKPTMQRTYIYEVIFGGITYDFRVTNPKVDMDNGISFKYKLTGDVGYNGTVTISKEAINTAHDQMNKFGKETIELDTRTSVWISNEVFNELKTKGSSMINANEWVGQREFTVVSEEGSDDNFYTVKVDGQDKYIKCFKAEAKDGEQLWINDDPKNPIILKMKVDFSIELKQIL